MYFKLLLGSNGAQNRQYKELQRRCPSQEKTKALPLILSLIQQPAFSLTDTATNWIYLLIYFRGRFVYWRTGVYTSPKWAWGLVSISVFRRYFDLPQFALFCIMETNPLSSSFLFLQDKNNNICLQWEHMLTHLTKSKWGEAETFIVFETLK